MKEHEHVLSEHGFFNELLNTNEHELRKILNYRTRTNTNTKLSKWANNNMCSPLFAEFDDLKKVFALSVVQTACNLRGSPKSIRKIQTVRDVRPILAVSTVRYFEKMLFGRAQNAIMNK